MNDATESDTPGAARQTLLRKLFAVHPVLAPESAGAERLKQALSVWALMAIGIGATIGTGIFVLTGTVAANQSGPAITISLGIAAFGSGLAALCYAEFAAFLPVPGSAYSYTYATLGEVMAWFIGWNLLLEYGISASAVAVSWSAYVVNLLANWGIHLPGTWIHAPFHENAAGHLVASGAIMNLPAALIVLALSALCYVGIQETARVTNVMVAVKVAVIVVFIVAGLKYVSPANWHPYIPPNTGTPGHFGWSLLLEYGISASAVAVSWSAYVVNLLANWGIHLPGTWIHAPFHENAAGHLVASGAIMNVPAALIVLALSTLCYVGIQETARVTNVMVVVKVAVIVVFIVAGLKYVSPANWHPYIPPNTGTPGHFGWSGVLRGAGIIFFSYVGFDTASTTALEVRNPQRDLPLGIIGTLVVSTVLYVAMAAVITGMVPYFKLNVDAPVAAALDAHPALSWLRAFVIMGAIIGMTSVILTSILGQPRILLSMADDGLLPPIMSRCHPRFKTPHVATAITGIGAALIAALFPLGVLADLISIGILLAFAVVCIGVLVMRHTRPDTPRPFRVPWAWVLCPLGAVVCLTMTKFLSNATWIRLVVWTALGAVIYVAYGYKHSKQRT